MSVDLAGSRDEQFRTYVLAHRGQLLRTATFLASGDRHAAEDLVQTALMRLYVAWPRVRTETVDAYARKSLLNALIDDRRRAFSRHERARAQVPDIAVDDPPASPTETAVFRALADLPPRMRAAVVLRHLTQHSVAETAEALGCSEGTGKSQTARALAQLRAALTESGVALYAPVAPRHPPVAPPAEPSADHPVRSSQLLRGTHE